MRARPLVVLALTAALCGTLTGCSESSDVPAIAENFQRQSSVSCSMVYALTLTEQDGRVETQIEHVYTADGELDLTNGYFHMLGEYAITTDGIGTETYELECYTETCDPNAEDVAYCRMGALYYTDNLDGSFLSAVLTPLSLHLSDYTRSEETELFFGSACEIYTGEEVASGAAQTYISNLTKAETSLAGATVAMQLLVYPSENLPARLTAEYTNLESMDISLAAGDVTYIPTDLRYEISYTGYGAATEINLPDGFKEAALAGGGEPTGFGATGESAAEATYLLTAGTDESCRMEIATPDYMTLEEAAKDSVSFYYLYGEQDYESICYTLRENRTSENERERIAELAEAYAALEGLSDLVTEDAESLTASDMEITYSVFRFTLEQDEIAYKVIDVQAWLPVEGGCLEIAVTEYNAEEGVLINPVTELEYACAYVLGVPD